MDVKIKGIFSNSKKGQITVFIILAILLVAAILLLYMLYQNQLQGKTGNTKKNTHGIFEECINDYVGEATELIFENSGYTELPALTYSVTNVKGYYKQFELKDIPYLCYTTSNYARCVPQAPLLINNLEKEIKEYIEPKAEFCFEMLSNDLKDRAYDVRLGKTELLKVNLRVNGVETSVKKELIQAKSGQEERVEEFNAVYRTPLYDVAKVAEKIIYEETTFCNSDYVEIMRGNTGIEIEKFQTGDDVKIYTVRDKLTKKEWEFAVRGCILGTPS